MPAVDLLRCSRNDDTGIEQQYRELLSTYRDRPWPRTRDDSVRSALYQQATLTNGRRRCTAVRCSRWSTAWRREADQVLGDPDVEQDRSKLLRCTGTAPGGR